MTDIPHFASPFRVPSIAGLHPAVGGGLPINEGVEGGYYYDRVARLLWGPKPDHGWYPSYAQTLLSFGSVGVSLSLDAETGLADLSGNGRDGTGAGGVTPGGYSPGPLAYGDDGATVFNGTYQAIITGYGTRRNLCPKPRTRSGQPIASYGLDATISTVLSSGSYVTRAVLTAAGTHGAFAADSELATVKAGDQITFSTDLNAIPAGRSIRLGIQWKDASKTIVGSGVYATVTSIGRRSVTGTAPAGAVWATPLYYIQDGQIGDTIDFNFTLIEHGSTAGLYFDGNTYFSPGAWTDDPGGHVGWLGTPWESASDKGCFANGTQRTLSAWLYMNTTVANSAFFGTEGNGEPFILTTPADPGRIQLKIGGSFCQWVGQGLKNQWAKYDFVLDEPGNTADLYVNGVFISRETMNEQYRADCTLLLGNRGDGANGFNGQMAWVSVHERALTADEITAAYLAGRQDLLTSPPGDPAAPSRHAQPSGAATVEQDSDEDLLLCVSTLLRTETGSRDELPSYGVDDLPFRGDISDEVVEAIRDWEPRTEADADSDIRDLIQNVEVYLDA